MRWPLISFSFDFLRFNLKFYWVWRRAPFINSVCIYTLRTGQSGGALQGGPIKDNHYEQLNKDFTLVSDFMLNQTASALTVKHTGVFGLVGERSFLSLGLSCPLCFGTLKNTLCASLCVCQQEAFSPVTPMSTRCFVSPWHKTRTSPSWCHRWTWWTRAAVSPWPTPVSSSTDGAVGRARGWLFVGVWGILPHF